MTNDRNRFRVLVAQEFNKRKEAVGHVAIRDEIRQEGEEETQLREKRITALKRNCPARQTMEEKY